MSRLLKRNNYRFNRVSWSCFCGEKSRGRHTLFSPYVQSCDTWKEKGWRRCPSSRTDPTTTWGQHRKGNSPASTQAFELKNRIHFNSLCDAFPRITRKKKVGVDFNGWMSFNWFKQICKERVLNRDGMEVRITHHFYCIYLKAILLKLMFGYILGLIRTIFLINPANIDLAV